MSQGFLPAARFAQRNVHKWVYELRQQTWRMAKLYSARRWRM
jgi:hypothetical protein